MDKPKKPKKRQELFMMRVASNDGVMQPADGFSRDRIQAKKYVKNDLIAITIRKTRKPWYHRKAHLFCRMVTENIEGFAGLGAHDCLKRIQLEGNIYCEVIHLNMPGIGPVEYKIPASISFDSMDEGEFEDLYKKLCQHISDTYWPSLSKDQIERMAELMPD
jgi:hypothetical protein